MTLQAPPNKESKKNGKEEDGKKDMNKVAHYWEHNGDTFLITIWQEIWMYNCKSSSIYKYSDAGEANSLTGS